jgi:hypothetical protein
MRPRNEFETYDEVRIVSKNKNGIVIDFGYSVHMDMYLYSVDCEDEKLICRENELSHIA